MNDHGLPLAMYPRQEICVTLEVATGSVGSRKEMEECAIRKTTVADS